MNIQTLNKISPVGINEFGANYNVSDDATAPDAILVRSAAMHDMEMPASLLAIARAGAGVNNIPVDKCAEDGIVVFNTPGANANAVKELAIATLLLASRDIVGGIAWAKTLEGDDVAKQVEKGKSNFAGHEIMGKTLGVIGLGAIGVNVANSAYTLGMKVCGYDPYMSVKSAWKLSRHVDIAASLDEIYEKGLSNAELARRIIEKGYNEYEVICDSAEPKSISDLRDCGIYSKACHKYPGCVQYRIKWLQRHKIVIDPKRTPNTAREMTMYSYQVDKNGNLESRLPDKENHSVDSLAYSLNSLIY